MHFRLILRRVIILALFTLAPTSVMTVSSQDGICESLRRVYATHGDGLTSYLNQAGRECLKSDKEVQRQDTTAESSRNTVWSSKGRGSKEVSVTLELSAGVYDLDLLKPENEGVWGTAWLRDVVSVPNDCFLWSYRVSFPTRIRIQKLCKIYGTLEVNQDYKPATDWSLSINERLDLQSGIPNADGWYAEGRGEKYVPMGIIFGPGAYRMQLEPPLKSEDQGFVQVRDIVEIPNRCFTELHGYGHESLPTQFVINQSCQLFAILTAYLYGASDDRSWKVSITRSD
ncbi:MAG: hypothetical protein OXG49_11290 [Chloroflexi bacterium]|nr:hypothetical protein [Chloroflexota bacterium]